MSGRRPVVYPPRHGPSFGDWLMLPVGLVIVLLAGGIGVVALAAVLTIPPPITDPRHGDVDAAMALIEAADAPSVRALAIEPALLGRRTLFVSLTRGTREADARSVWCDVILPTGVGREFVQVNGGGGQWRAPRDCADPTSQARFDAPYD